jgi:hypothetical protein
MTIVNNSLAALILDQSNRTSQKTVSDFLKVIHLPLNFAFKCDIMEKPALESGFAEQHEIISGLFTVSSEVKPDIKWVPARTAQVASFFQGEVPNFEELDAAFSKPATSQEGIVNKLLLNLGSIEHATKYSKFAHRVHFGITEQMRGQWQSITTFLGPKSSISVNNRLLDWYFSVATVSTAMILCVSSIPDAISSIIQAIPEDSEYAYLKSKVFVSNIAVASNTTVIHPIHLLPKVRHWGINRKFNAIQVVYDLERYLNNQAVKLGQVITPTATPLANLAAGNKDQEQQSIENKDTQGK